MMKKISAIVLALAVSVVLAFGCFAADEPTGSATYDGETLKVTGSMSGFSDMVPGLPASGSIQLKNTSKNTANFFMDTDVVQTLVNETWGKKDTGYSVTLSCGDNVIYGYDPATGVTGSLVGGLGTDGLEELNKVLDGPLLVATLEPSAETRVEFTLVPDGRATTNEYQKATGLVEFRFLAADVIPEIHDNIKHDPDKDVIITEDRYIYQAVKTGDPSSILGIGAALAAALAVLAVVVLKKKKGGK